MQRPRRKRGSDAPAPPKPSAKKITPAEGTVSDSVKTGTTITPTVSQIAALAYQLWIDRGCPAGSDEEDWLRAEEILRNLLAMERDDRLRDPLVLRDTEVESEMLADFPWEGHWEIWEREWGGARWVWDCT